jgi:hypothetical protein
MKAISLPEKSAESKKRRRNTNTDRGSISALVCILQIKTGVILDNS